MKTNTLNKIIFSVLVLAVVITFNIFYLSKINDKYDNIAETKKTIIVESAKSRSVLDTKRQIEELNKINDRINSVLISESNAVSFIGLIESIAATSGANINITSVDFNDPAEEKDLGILDMKFRVSGTWGQVISFLNSLESLPYLINVNSIRLSVMQSEDGNIWSMDFGLIGLTI